MIVDSKELLYILRRALNTLDPQKAPKWATEACEWCESVEGKWQLDRLTNQDFFITSYSFEKAIPYVPAE